MSVTGVMLLIFGVAIGVATFIENDFGQAGSQAVVYKAVWFEILLALLVINMIGTIFVHKLYRREKWINLLFHCAFIVILFGAAITRFIGQEGIMHIREGKSSNSFISDDTYVLGSLLVGEETKHFEKKVLFTPIKKSRFNKTVHIADKKVSFHLTHFIQNAQQVVVDDPEGHPIVTVVTTGDKGRQNRFLSQGEVIGLGDVNLGFDLQDSSLIQLFLKDGVLMFKSPVDVGAFSMDTQERSTFPADSTILAPFRHLLTVKGINFVLSNYNESGKVKLVSTPVQKNMASNDALVMEITSGQEKQELVIFGGKGYEGTPQFVKLGGVNIKLSFGSKRFDVPFQVALNDFQLERYPGSNSPSSYASEVTVYDGPTQFPFKIYMNHILSYKGYRFYQSSYDDDELGTVLSVNKDRPGTFVTYTGYLLLAIGLISILFSKNTRFAQLLKLVSSVQEKRHALTAGMVVFFFTMATHSLAMDLPDTPAVDQAVKFGRLVYQTKGGRMAPINSLASDLLRKVYKKTSLEGLTPEQVMLGMMSNPFEWQKVPMIQVRNENIQGILGIHEKYTSFAAFFDDKGHYKLVDQVNAAYEKRPAQRGTFDKDLIKIDERVNICYLIYQGYLLRIFPVPNDSEHHWVTPVDDNYYTLTGSDSSFARSAATEYLKSIATGNLKQADYILSGIHLFQNKYGKEVLPSKKKLNMEIGFNRLNIFERIFPYYMLSGFLLLIVLFIGLLVPTAQRSIIFKSLIWLGVISIGLLFIAHGIGLGFRWYISGHAPWSNGYESMIYIAWTGMLAGFIFGRKSVMTLSVTAVLAGIILFVAHLSWMDPEITNLEPVLKSYWLTVHVATITSSYGFLGLGALLAFVNLITMVFKTRKNALRLGLSVKELTYVIEMTLTIGLILLTIGNFLGGVWANESWGRYWGWDPKETWAMATIIFYAFVLHMRFIPGLKTIFTFNFASLIAYSSVLMTYFGVNFYLSGLHSYAKGDPVPIPTFVYYTIAVIAIVSLLAYWNEQRLKNEHPDELAFEG